MHKVDVKEKARAREIRILNYWKEKKAFKKSIELRDGEQNFVIYEGPPTANGKPHIGHVLGRVIKDFVGRYKTMTGHCVVRKAGWDTHGLPVELGVEKQLGLSGKLEIENYGIEAFIKKCKESVFIYEQQWQQLTEAIGYWLDLEDPYITLDNQYIQSVWNILATIHDKGLLYQGHRVSPYCPSCQTTLSSHELAQGYKTVKDLTATVKFKLKETQEYALAWTTTPWTLPTNMALAVHPELSYVRIVTGDEKYVVAAGLVTQLFDQKFTILETIKGKDLIGLTYEPLFPYNDFDQAYRIIGADYVTDSSGTGIVHISPAHGEEDYRVAKKNKIPIFIGIDHQGKFKDIVSDFAGRFVKDCDVEIVQHLFHRGLLFKKEKIEHQYPFCWRCDQPLLYYATESWFIRTTALKNQLIANNNKINWQPEHLQQGRFGKFLEELVDWNISRTRYWGTPLNVWICKKCHKQKTPHSISELRAWAIEDVSENIELHKPYVDNLHFPCECGGTMARTPEVVDVWFDSGSMPFAQYFYPFADKADFKKQYPADLIVEGIDQTRGWFYSLLTISTLFYGESAYKAVLSTGHVLDEKGQKMSKSKGNVINPWEIIQEFGADAFRWSLLADSAPWNSKRFSKGIVADAKSKVVDTLVNIHAFYVLYAQIDGYYPGKKKTKPPTHLLDRWILSSLNTLVQNVTQNLNTYDFLNAAKAIELFIDDLSNWYVRRSRDRFWGSGFTNDKLMAFQTLEKTLLILSKLIAPFAPFLAEDIFTNLGGKGSVHWQYFPEPILAVTDKKLEYEMKSVRSIVEKARNIRNEFAIKTRQPLSELFVSFLEPFDLFLYEDIIKEEINVKKITIVQEDNQFTDFNLKLNLQVAGRKFGRYVSPIQLSLKQMSPAQTKQIVTAGMFKFVAEDGTELTITQADLLIEKRAKVGYASASDGQMTITLNTEITAELSQEGWVREVIRVIQDMRKKRDFPLEQRIFLTLSVDEQLKEILISFDELLRNHVLIQSVTFATVPEMEIVKIREKEIGIAMDGHAKKHNLRNF